MIKLSHENLLFSTMYVFNLIKHMLSFYHVEKMSERIAILELMQEILFMNELSHCLSRREKYS